MASNLYWILYLSIIKMGVISITAKTGGYRKIELFMQKLNEVEQRHIDWFKKRPAIFDSQEYDSIKNHIFSEEDGNLVRFNFWKYSELPEDIKTECLVAFEEVYGYKISA